MIERGEIYEVDLGVPEGHEAGWPHPGLIVSDPRMHEFGLVIVCPVTSTRHGWPSHIEVEPAASGLAHTSYIQTEQVRCLSASRLRRRSGAVDVLTLHQVERALRRNLGL